LHESAKTWTPMNSRRRASSPHTSRHRPTAAQRSFLTWILLLPLFIAPLQRSFAADEPADGPKRIFKDVLIENLTGDWKLTRKIRGKEVQNTVQVEWVLNHQFLQIHMKDVAEPPTYEALVLIGYSYADKNTSRIGAILTAGNSRPSVTASALAIPSSSHFSTATGPFITRSPGTLRPGVGPVAWNPRTRKENACCSQKTLCGESRSGAS
jgi:hypothetical protein